MVRNGERRKPRTTSSPAKPAPTTATTGVVALDSVKLSALVDFPLGANLVLQAETGRGLGLEPGRGDRAATRFADAITTLVQLAQRVLYLGQLPIEHLLDRDFLLELEGLGRHLRRVLVDRGQLGETYRLRLHGPMPCSQALQAALLVLEPLAHYLHFHDFSLAE